ncbi:hypothetical protein GGR46_001929 [Sphingomonas kyeonggiensis]|uniref:Uncharacterized protein n=1 Tax=Sphingomonas kyeonggiensis TaxID=1268553 RepID=A0A7W6JRW7_9SPHN|nr:hypothetical protein [Sphingomonas kyeonggiensis]
MRKLLQVAKPKCRPGAAKVSGNSGARLDRKRSAARKRRTKQEWTAARKRGGKRSGRWRASVARSGCRRRHESAARSGKEETERVRTLVRGNGCASARLRERRNGPPGDRPAGCGAQAMRKDLEGSSGEKRPARLPTSGPGRRDEAGRRGWQPQLPFGVSGQRPASTTDPKLACPCRREWRSRRNLAERSVRVHGSSPATRGLAAMPGPFCVLGRGICRGGWVLLTSRSSSLRRLGHPESFRASRAPSTCVRYSQAWARVFAGETRIRRIRHLPHDTGKAGEILHCKRRGAGCFRAGWRPGCSVP